ncbi:MAG: 3-oxoacid CoA-transferase subunit B [Chloroflexota bacterium]
MRLKREQMAARVAAELEDGWFVNLGIGIPTLTSSYVTPGREVILQSENGLVGMGPLATQPEQRDPQLINASKEHVTLVTGASIVHHADSFAIIRGKHLDAAILGGMQVSEHGDLANWRVPEEPMGSIGGAMDVAIGAKRLFVVMTHTTREGAPKVVHECTYPLTALNVVKKIFTDIAVISITDAGLILEEVVEGWTPDSVQACTEPHLTVAAELRVIDPASLIPVR